MFFKGDRIKLEDHAEGQYEGLDTDEIMTVKAAEHYGVFVEGFDFLILASDIKKVK